MKFTAESFYNSHLAVGAKRLDAVVTVTAVDDGAAMQKTGRLLIIFVGDVSGSMDGDKLQQMKHAIRVGVDCLDQDTLFSVIAFHSNVQVVMPATLATASAKSAAHLAVQALRAGGGTVMSEALLAAVKQADAVDADIVQVYFVTDGENDKNDGKALDKAIAVCDKKLQASCWGVGTDWHPRDLRLIAGRLLGSADAVPDPEQLQNKFKEALAQGMAKGINGVKLRLWVPRTVQIVTLKQMSPEIADLKDLCTRIDDKTIEVPLGAWGAENRDYHFGFDIAAQAEGEEMMVCRPKIAYQLNGAEVVVDGQRIVATWSADDALTTRINAQVAHYTGQEELASSIKEGLEAKARGDVDQATRLLGKAAKIAIETGNDEVTQRLKKVVDVIDPQEGTVRLRAGASKGDDMELDMGGTRTVRRRPAASTVA
ncbi:VWA domain-containing protein [Paraherbaspirillum soli]|uniref:VWA domain-containing protein n=1 Tax=Paraherbaspirillum soli TaxID=631222 RepID=A0ABW0M955_9BURK